MTLQSPPESLLHCHVVPELPDTYSPELRKLVLECYTVDASTRPTAIKLLDACIQRGSWKDSCVSPYGYLIASDFDATLKETWRDCLDKMSYSVKNITSTTRAPGLLDDSFKIMELAQPDRYGKLAIFIAGEASTDKNLASVQC
jgi:hypothetical protein